MLALVAALAFVIGLVINLIKGGSHVVDAELIGLTLVALDLAFGSRLYGWGGRGVRGTGTPPQ